jgi:hypothetical protein
MASSYNFGSFSYHQMMAELVHNRPLMTCCCFGQRRNENNKTGGDDGAKRDRRKQMGLPNFGCGQKMVIRAIFGYDDRTLIVDHRTFEDPEIYDVS